MAEDSKAFDPQNDPRHRALWAKLAETNPAREQDQLRAEDVENTLRALAQQANYDRVKLISEVCEVLSNPMAAAAGVAFPAEALVTLHQMLHHYLELITRYEPDTELGRVVRDAIERGVE